MVLISGNIPFKTEVASVFIFGQIESDRATAAAAVSVLLLVISLRCAARRLAVLSAQREATSSDGCRACDSTIALGYLAALLVRPVGLVFYRTFEHGLGAGLGRRHDAGGACTRSG